MATTCRLNNSSVLNQPRRAYVTTGAFADAIFSYTTSTSVSNGQVNTTGVLAALGASVVTSTYNVAGTILRENGKKIVPGVNPITTGTVQYYVGVYHPVFGSGFIDPNNALFAVYNSDKPYIYNGADLLVGNNGPTSTKLVLQNSITLSQATTTTLTADCSLASLFYIDIATADNFQINASNVSPGQFVSFILNIDSAAVTPTVTFGDNIRVNQTSATLTITSARQATIAFIGCFDATTPYLMELSRIAIISTA